MECVAGIDWASESHQVEFQTDDGELLWNDSYGTDLDSLYGLRDDLLDAVEKPEHLKVGIEDPKRPVVRVLLEANIPVFVLSPRQTNAVRAAYSQAERKDDELDAHIICDELRVHENLFYQLVPQPGVITALSHYSRAYESAKEEVNRFANKLRDKLRDFFPQFLELEWDLDSRVMLDLLELIRTPRRLEEVDAEAIDEVLGRCRLHSAEEVLEILRADAPPLDSQVVEAASEIALHQIEQLRAALRAQEAWSEKVEDLLDDIADQQKAGELPTAFQDKETGGSEAAGGSDSGEPSHSPDRSDIEIALSVPGVGTTTVAGLFGEAFQAIALGDRELLRRQSIAPVTEKSGRTDSSNGPPPLVRRRYARNHHLNNTMHQIGDSLQKHNGHYRARYVGMRDEKNHTHGRACRQIADQFLRVFFAMLRDRTTYDASKHGATRR